MTKQPYTTAGPPSSELEFTSSDLRLRDAARHDEWLLDEALAETFPASDSIAVSLHSPVTDKRA